MSAILALRDLSSLTKAGQRLHLSPSAVFSQIRQIEEELGQKVYERGGKHLRLTDFGHQLAKHAAAIIGARDSAMESLRQSTQSRRPVLRVGCGPNSSIRVMPYLLRAFLAVQPNTEIRLTTSDEVMYEDLRLGSLDAILGALPLGDADFQEQPLFSFERVLVLPPERKGLQKNVTAADLREYPFILYRRAMVSELTFVTLCRELGFEPNIVMENDEVDSIKELVKLGIGATFLPYWSVGDEVRQGALRVLHISFPRCNYGLINRWSRFQPHALGVLKEVASNWCEWWPMAPYVHPPLP